MAPHSDKARGQRGNVQLGFLFCIPLLLLALALGADLSRAYSAGIIQKQALDDAAQEILVRQEEIKFSEDPSALVRDMVAESLCRDGYTGSVELSYYEESHLREDVTDNDERHIVVEIATGRQVRSALAGGFAFPVSDSVVVSVLPYATYTVYRPGGSTAPTGTRYQMTLSDDGTGATTHTTDAETTIDRDDLSAKATEALDSMKA